METKSSSRWAYYQRLLIVMLGGLSLIGFSGKLLAKDLPTSSYEVTDFWLKMHPSSFAGSIDSAIRQCMRDAGYSSSDALTKVKCTLFKDKLKAGSCSVEKVPDGITFDLLNGRSYGKSAIWTNREKKTGRKDRALLCDLDGGLYGYWFTGVKVQSCNNVAFVLPPPKTLTRETSSVVYVNPPTKSYFSDSLRSNNLQVLPGFGLKKCWSNTQFINGILIGDQGTLQSNGYYFD